VSATNPQKRLPAVRVRQEIDFNLPSGGQALRKWRQSRAYFLLLERRQHGFATDNAIAQFLTYLRQSAQINIHARTKLMRLTRSRARSHPPLHERARWARDTPAMSSCRSIFGSLIFFAICDVNILVQGAFRLHGIEELAFGIFEKNDLATHGRVCTCTSTTDRNIEIRWHSPP